MDPLFGSLLGVVVQAPEDWERLAQERRGPSRVDPVADTMEYLAADLRERLKLAQRAAERLSAEQFAALPHIRVTPQTVRAWCRRAELPGAVLTERGWEIPRDARRVAASERRAGRARARGSARGRRVAAGAR